MTDRKLRAGQWEDEDGYLHDDRFPERKWVYCSDDQGWCDAEKCMAAVACQDIDPEGQRDSDRTERNH